MHPQESDMNIYDVSKKAGVSIATVSRVLNGNAKVSSKPKIRFLPLLKSLITHLTYLQEA